MHANTFLVLVSKTCRSRVGFLSPAFWPTVWSSIGCPSPSRLSVEAVGAGLRELADLRLQVRVHADGLHMGSSSGGVLVDGNDLGRRRLWWRGGARLPRPWSASSARWLASLVSVAESFA
jgi:hypothetical protein